jgi:hypothetical protein
MAVIQAYVPVDNRISKSLNEQHYRLRDRTRARWQESGDHVDAVSACSIRTGL